MNGMGIIQQIQGIITEVDPTQRILTLVQPQPMRGSNQKPMIFALSSAITFLDGITGSIGPISSITTAIMNKSTVNAVIFFTSEHETLTGLIVIYQIYPIPG